MNWTACPNCKEQKRIADGQVEAAKAVAARLTAAEKELAQLKFSLGVVSWAVKEGAHKIEDLRAYITKMEAER